MSIQLDEANADTMLKIVGEIQGAVQAFELIVKQAVISTVWRGPDAEGFKYWWPTESQRLRQTANNLVLYVDALKKAVQQAKAVQQSKAGQQAQQPWPGMSILDWLHPNTLDPRA